MNNFINIFVAKTNDFCLEDQYFSFLVNEIKSVSSKSLIKQKFALWAFFRKICKSKYNFDPDKDFVYKNEYGKPFAKDDKTFFSVAHTQDLIVVVFSNLNVGVDLEKHKNNVNLDKLIKRISSCEDISISKLEQFYDLWTKKEAVFKLNGNEKTFVPKNVLVSSKNINTYRINFNEDIYSLSVASDDECEVEFIDCEFLKIT